ncbi:MAG: cation:proton antiporter [Helicobacteraceae bacterium]|jgi:CPA2 family monovalent cation:H+ antiporter-2|nr:cation:proton antiporter [Helicobacteraceae bacterium]
MDSILLVVIAASAIAIVLNIYLKKLDIPPVIGYIASGVIVAQLFSIGSEHHALDELGEFGIVFLMFTIGLEFSLDYLRAMKREVFLFGFLQVVVSAALFSVIAIWGMGIEPKAAVVLSSALSMSSTAIVLKLLKERGEIGKPYGKQALGILIFQDIAVIPVLLMVTLFSKPDVAPLQLILQMSVSAVIVLIVLSTIGKLAITKLLELSSNSQTHEIFIGSVLLIVVGAALLAHEFGFSYSLGALIAGIMIAETHYKHQVEADLAPFRDLLLGVFFVTVGLQINVKLVVDNIGFIAVFVVAAMLLKAVVIYIIARVLSDKSSAIRSAIALMQMGEFGFAIFALATQADILPDKDFLGRLSAAIAISMILTPFIIKNTERIASLFERGKKRLATPNIEAAETSGHVIVIGYGEALGRQVAQMLKEREIPYICVEGQYQKVEEGFERGHAVMLGNATQRSILEHAGIKSAAAVIIAIDRENDIRFAAEAVIGANPNVNLVIKINHATTPGAFSDLHSAKFVDEYREAARLMIESALNTNDDKEAIGR